MADARGGAPSTDGGSPLGATEARGKGLTLSGAEGKGPPTTEPTAGKTLLQHRQRGTKNVCPHKPWKNGYRKFSECKEQDKRSHPGRAGRKGGQRKETGEFPAPVWRQRKTAPSDTGDSRV